MYIKIFTKINLLLYIVEMTHLKAFLKICPYIYNNHVMKIAENYTS